MAKARPDKRNGVTVTEWKGHPSYKWRVSFPDGGKRRSKGFRKKSGEEGALEFAGAKREEVLNEGTRHESLTDEERRAVIAFRNLVKKLPKSNSSPTLIDAITLFEENQNLRHRSKSVSEIVEKYLISLKRKGIGDDYHYTIRKRLERFTGDYGEWLACDISQELTEEWLEDLMQSPTSYNHFRAALVQLFNHALDFGTVDKNPISKIAKKKKGTTEIEILTVPEAKALLLHASEEIIPGLVLGMFAGIRRAELCRMDWSEIDFEQDLVEVTAAKAKTAARRLIPMRPNLKAWLFPHRKSEGQIMPTEMVYRNRLDAARKGASIQKWPHNALRHSFTSYNLAAFQDAPALALEMGHGDTRMIFEHYRALVTPNAGKAFWKIHPSK